MDTSFDTGKDVMINDDEKYQLIQFKHGKYAVSRTSLPVALINLGHKI